MPGMHGRLTHLAINADDLPSTQRFYEGVFGWSFEEYMPGFNRTRDAGIDVAAIQGRRNLLDVPTNGPEPTFEVDDLDAFVAQALELGARVLMEPATIPTVGRLAFVADPSGNVVGAITYE
jgi:predicted enzyme related to lactoylglutathione lyase